MTEEWIASSSLLILIVLLLRAGLGKRISAGLRYGLWAVVLVRLLVPVSFFSWSVTASIPQLPTWTMPETMREESIYVLPVEVRPLENSGVHVLEDGKLGDSHSFGYPKLTRDGETVVRYADRISPLELLGWTWTAGAAAMGIVLAAANLRFFNRLRRVRKPLEGTSAPIPVYVAAGVPSPCLLGLLRPAVYVTEEAAANPAMLRHVLAHELTHYNHRDHLWSILRGAALAVHWWNPLVWLAVSCSRRDGELACDEGALKHLGDSERTAYGETLLALVTAKSKPGDLLSFATTMSGGKRSLKERVQRIACRPKRLISAMVAVIAVLTLSTLVAFGQGRAAEDSKKESGLPVQTGQHTEEWQDGQALTDETAIPQADLDHDGIPDTLTLRKTEDAGHTLWTLQVIAGHMSAPIWEDEAITAHVGWKGIFLYRMNGEDFLLEYMPYMGGGRCDYSYKLFYLTADGEEVVVQEDSVEFDIDFGSEWHQYDPEAINAFMEEINTLLTESELLVNTDENLIRTFQEEGRLYDSVWWLKDDRDDSLTLLENLRNFASYAEDHPDDTWSPLADLLLDLTEEDIPMFSGDAAGLVRLLRAAERESRFYTWKSKDAAYRGAGADEADYTIWNVPLADGSTLWLLACEERPSVLMIYETPEESVSAFYKSPELRELIITGFNYSFNEYGTGVLITGLNAAYVEWLFPTEIFPRGQLYFANPGFLGIIFEGKQAEGSALWVGEEQISVSVTVDDPQDEGGTISGPSAHFTVALDSGAVVDRHPDAAKESETLKLTEQEMVSMARVLAGLMTAAENYYNRAKLN